MQKKVVKGTTENLSLLNEKVEYIGFELGEVPAFLKDFEPLNYRVPKAYDETTYKIYKYVPIEDIEILITPTNRLEELEERYKYASPLFTYMKAQSNEDIEKYAKFLRMINQTKLEDIQTIEKNQENMQKNIPFEVKFNNNFKWQIYYSDYANKYFMLASTEEVDNSELFYLLKEKIIEHNDKRRKKNNVFVPICNEEYSEKILKKSDIADLENYLWYFTKNWPSIYEVTDEKNELSLQIIGETLISDKITSLYKIKYTDKKEATKKYNLIKALFILSYDIANEYKFDTRINKDGELIFCYNGEEINYENLSIFMQKEARAKIKENIRLKLETNELKADIKDLQKHSKEQNEEYLREERQIYTFLECKKTFFGKVKYFFRSKKKEEEENITPIAKERMEAILSKDKKEEKLYEKDDKNELYTVEDIIKICKELNESIKENKNVKLDIEALNTKIDNIDRKIKNAKQYIEEIEKHKKSIFEFWKFANKDEVRVLEEGNIQLDKKESNLKRTFSYEDDMETLAKEVDKKQRENLTHNEMDATFAANFVLEGINIISKTKILKTDEEKIDNILKNLQEEYSQNIERIEKKDFDIFGNISEDKSKMKVLNNTTHREVEKDKFKILNVNLKTQIKEFTDKLREIRDILEEETNKINTPYNISIYKASKNELDLKGFQKFSINPQEALEKIETADSDATEIYLYKINIEENTNLIFYSNIIFYENNNATLPLGMDVTKETLLNMKNYNFKLKESGEFNINVCKNNEESFVRKVKLYEYDIKDDKQQEEQDDK